LTNASNISTAAFTRHDSLRFLDAGGGLFSRSVFPQYNSPEGAATWCKPVFSSSASAAEKVAADDDALYRKALEKRSLLDAKYDNRPPDGNNSDRVLGSVMSRMVESIPESPSSTAVTFCEISSGIRAVRRTRAQSMTVPSTSLLCCLGYFLG
jgi:hypothetical protein